MAVVEWWIAGHRPVRKRHCWTRWQALRQNGLVGVDELSLESERGLKKNGFHPLRRPCCFFQILEPNVYNQTESHGNHQHRFNAYKCFHMLSTDVSKGNALHHAYQQLKMFAILMIISMRFCFHIPFLLLSSRTVQVTYVRWLGKIDTRKASCYSLS